MSESTTRSQFVFKDADDDEFIFEYDTEEPTHMEFLRRQVRMDRLNPSTTLDFDNVDDLIRFLRRAKAAHLKWQGLGDD